ncbi:MAG: calcium/sodium antiporter [Candidatus Caenarcaniphilales bacterium]|nr:calcium/sodium antiporter [Candidatus Caenarcaniphilales bacterium]
MFFVLFVLGFVLLIKGADILVEGSSSLAKKFRISNFIIGLTVVAFGTSAPELVVSGLASYQGSGDIAISNVLGSNIANTLLILGSTALICPLVVHNRTVRREIPLNFFSIFLLFLLSNDALIYGVQKSFISRVDASILLFTFVIFLFFTFRSSSSRVDGEEFSEEPVLKSILFILLGLLGLSIGGKWIVDGAIQIAQYFGVSKSFVGLTIIAIGTSLPELAASIMAAMKKNPDLAIGNALGSNLFNSFWILGSSALINPLPFDISNNIDLVVFFGACVLLTFFIVFGKRLTIIKWEGAVMLLAYLGYLSYLVLQQAS